MFCRGYCELCYTVTDYKASGILNLECVVVVFDLTAGFDDISDCIDLIICLGGDGTLLYASSLFQVITMKTLTIYNFNSSITNWPHYDDL